MTVLRVAEHRWYPAEPHEQGMTAPEIMISRHNRIPGLALADVAPLVPFLNHGRWLVRCPDCPSASLASQVDPRFFCVECMADGDPWLPVLWPDDNDVAEAERVEITTMPTRGGVA